MFTVDKIIGVKLKSTDSLDLVILEQTENYLTKVTRSKVKLFSVDYKEIRIPSPRVQNPKLGFRYFHIKSAKNQKDK